MVGDRVWWMNRAVVGDQGHGGCIHVWWVHRVTVDDRVWWVIGCGG